MRDIDSERALAATTADLLDQGRILDRLSRLLTAAALAAALLSPASTRERSALVLALLGLAALAGLAECWLAVRAGFDATLFRRLADPAVPLDLRGLDATLRRLALLPEAKAGRPLEARCAGATRLLFRQSAAVLAQVLLLLAAAAVAALS